MVAAESRLPVPVIPNILSVSYAKNTGIAFGALQGSNIILSIISVAVAALIIRYLNKAKEGAEKAAMALILGGALGNLIDRVFRGAVIDYITLKGMPAFNIADAALTAGAALIIASYIVQKLRKEE